jgi:hypothetical protein
VRQLIKRILKEEREKDLSPLIKKLLNDSVVKDYKGTVCSVDVIAPWKRISVNPNHEEYEIRINIVGGIGSKNWPQTQFVHRQRDKIIEDVWDTVYNYLGITSSIFTRNVNSCDEVLTESSNERIERLISNYIAMSYPTAKKIRLAPPGVNGSITTFTLPNPEDEKDNLIFKFDVFGKPEYNINPEFFNSIKSLFGEKKNIKKLILKWFEEKEIDEDLIQNSDTHKQEQNESKGTNRKDLDFFDLVNKEIIFITEPFGDGKKQKSNWEGDSNIITLWNLENPEKGQEWVFDAIKYPKPEAIQWWNDEGQYTLKDEKYNQILRSIKMYDNSNKQEQNESIDDIQGIPLYHHTTESRALSIMNSDMMRGTKPDDDILDVDPTLANTKHQSMVSFTRDKNFAPNETIGASAGGLGDSNKLKVIFVVDKDKLKSNYKIVPFDYSALEDRWYDKRMKDEPDTIMQPKAIRTSKSNEYEERVLTNKIQPLRRYVTDIIYRGDNPLVQEKIDEYLGKNKQEQNESELTERCWKGYTQKGMKTMFGKRYPNCVKVKK